MTSLSKLSFFDHISRYPQHAWFCDKCKTAQFETFEEAEEHEATCTESPDDSFEDGESKEQWWKNFHDKVMRSGLNINALEHGGKVVMLLQILGTLVSLISLSSDFTVTHSFIFHFSSL